MKYALLPLLAIALFSTLGVVSSSVVVFDSGTPPSPGGLVGYDIFEEEDRFQLASVRFIPGLNVTFESLSIVCMSLAGPEMERPNVTLSLLECLGPEQPSADPSLCLAIEEWEDVGDAAGAPQARSPSRHTTQ